jgi:prophage maintenance system killer protein
MVVIEHKIDLLHTLLIKRFGGKKGKEWKTKLNDLYKDLFGKKKQKVRKCPFLIKGISITTAYLIIDKPYYNGNLSLAFLFLVTYLRAYNYRFSAPKEEIIEKLVRLNHHKNNSVYNLFEWILFHIEDMQ